MTGQLERSAGERNSEDRIATRISSDGFCLAKKWEHRPSLVAPPPGVSTCIQAVHMFLGPRMSKGGGCKQEPSKGESRKLEIFLVHIK